MSDYNFSDKKFFFETVWDGANGGREGLLVKVPRSCFFFVLNTIENADDQIEIESDYLVVNSEDEGASSDAEVGQVHFLTVFFPT